MARWLSSEPCFANWPLRWRRGFGAVLVAAALCAGCLGGQTGTENSIAEHPCVEQPVPVAADARTELGFSAADVITLAGGTHSAPAEWSESSEMGSFGPEHGSGTIEIRVDAEPDSARFVHYDTNGSSAGSGCGDDELLIDAQVTLTSSGGALAETFPVVLHATRGMIVHASARLALANVAGAFEVEPASGYTTSTLFVSFTIDAQGFGGSVSGQLEMTVGGSASATFVPYVCWPAQDGVCAPPSGGRGL